MKLKTFVCLTLILLIVFPQSTVFANSSADKKALKPTPAENGNLYSAVLNHWKKEGLHSPASFQQAVNPSHFITSNNKDFLPKEKSKGYHGKVFFWKNKDKVSIHVDVNEDGLYELAFDYLPVSNGLIPIQGAITINGQSQYDESGRIGFPVQWKSKSEHFQKDRYGNEIIPNQEMVSEWQTVKAEDGSYMYDQPLKFHLKKGKNTITLENVSGEAYLGNITVTDAQGPPSYSNYQENHSHATVQNSLHTYEAEHPYEKSSSYIHPVSTKDPSVTPYNSKHALLNTYGGDSWYTSGQGTSWKIHVNKDGLYHIALKALQNKETGAPSFRTILIDGQVPFSEMTHYQFNYTKDWTNDTLSNKKGNPYSFYLTKGTHVMTFVADAAPTEPVIETINQVTQGIDDLSLSIQKLTGNQPDQARDWKIADYIPNIAKRLNAWADGLDHQANYLKSMLSSHDHSKEVVSLEQSVDKLRHLAQSPNDLPNRLNELSEGSDSVAQSLGDLTETIEMQPLLLDKIYVYGKQTLPKAQAGWLTETSESIKRFFLSFTSGNYTTSKVNDKNTVEVWVNRPRQYVELMQNMADRNFTPKTGIKVKFSIMPDETKLVLASAAGNQPDVALGISNYLPYDLALRGGAVDLRQFKDFNKVARNFSPGAFLPFVINNSIYALPETQDFNVLFYRKDILNKLHLPVPDTWNDVLDILPELQRYGMNFYTPIAGAVGSKPFQTTAPFIFQFGGKLYKDEGMKTAIDDQADLKAIQFMGDLNTIYSMPLQVPNFYSHFRYGTLPIGISNFQTYVQLKTAAPEIAGQWAIAPSPGVKQKDGTVARWQPGSAQSAMIFKGTEKKQKAWTFLKWWESTKTQTDFGTNLQMTYGPGYMWDTANLNAFKQLPWPKADKDAILKQWQYMKEVPKTPGAYMLERELSNIWNDIVFNGENTREAVDDSLKVINHEFAIKMEEFGYMKNGKIVKPYKIPSIQKVKSWLGENNDK